MKAWMACPTHSVPERVDREHPGIGRCYPLHGCSNLLAANLDAALLNVSPTTMPLTPPMGSRKAVIDPDGSLPPPRGVVSRAAPSNVCLAEKRSSPNSTKTCARFALFKTLSNVCGVNTTLLLCELWQLPGPLMANGLWGLFPGMNPPLPCLKKRILGNNKKNFHARVLDGSDLVSDRASCIASRIAPWYAPFRNAGSFFMTNALSRKTSSKFTSSSVANAQVIARLLFTTRTTISSSELNTLGNVFYHQFSIVFI